MATYGVSKLNYSAKYQNSYLETGILTPINKRSELENLIKLFVNYATTLPASCAVVVKYKTKHEAGFTTAAVINDTKLVQGRVEELVNEIAALQIRLEFTVNGNNSPEIESVSFEE